MSKSHILIVLLPVLFGISGCKDKIKKGNNSHMADSGRITFSEIKASNFETEIEGKKVGLYTLKNKNGIEATFTNYGQRLISLYVPDKNGNFDDIVLGFPSLHQYRTAREKYFGATIGRYGNRIAQGKFSIDTVMYTLATNNGSNHLHGGNKGFESVVWDGQQKSDNEIEFYRTSPHMEEGYPGNLSVKVTYRLTDGNELIINYKAHTDKKTVLNLTHHSFFNLKGHGNGTINGHMLQINADRFTPVDKDLIPTGELRKVENTPFDFRTPKPIGQDLNSENQQLKYGLGYDHNFVLNTGPKNSDGLSLAAKVVEPETGRTMEVWTNEPGLQFYGGNFLKGEEGKLGKTYDFRGAFCLETQHFPNSPNQENFPSTALNAGETYTSTCVYKFSLTK